MINVFDVIFYKFFRFNKKIGNAPSVIISLFVMIASFAIPLLMAAVFSPHNH